ncbi:testis-expressed protein 52-like isoform X2 [Tubulanus polymorphus]
MKDEEETKLPSLEERENLMKEVTPKYSGFTPRPVEKLAVTRRPKSMLNIECNHVLRTDRADSVHLNPSLQYKLWLEAGKHSAPHPSRPDDSYNSNIWRNFRKNYGFDSGSDGRNITELIASMYPINIPKPSAVSKNTYDKYIRESDVFKDDKRRALAIIRSKTDISEFRRLRAKSEARYPPIDKDGNILPPPDFERYVTRFIPPNDFSTGVDPATEITADMRPDMFGRYIRRHNRDPHLYKMSYRLNNPQYARLQEEIERRRNMPKQFPPAAMDSRSPRIRRVSIGIDV